MAESTVSGTNTLHYPTDYDLVKLDLITSMSGSTNGKINLMPFMVELNLYEDIYSSTISGEVVIGDSLGLFSSFLFNGTEFIDVELQKTNDTSTNISRNYRVFKTSKRDTAKNNDSEVYVLSFCSEEFLLSEQYRLSKSYKGKLISDIITDILQTYVKVGKGNTKKIYIEKTDGPYDFILPNKKIFETINWLSTYAQPSSGNPGGDMIFFENNFGYWFQSLQSLYEQTTYGTYRYDPKNINNDINKKVTNVMSFEVLNFFDTLAATTNGTFANRLLTIDPLTRTFHQSDFNYDTYRGKSKNLDVAPLINNYQNRFGQTMYDPLPEVSGMEMGTFRLTTSNFEQKKNSYIAQDPDTVANDISIEQFLPNRVSQMAQANYIRIKLSVPGDPLLYVGKVVTFNVWKISPTSNQTGTNITRDVDPLYSGNYIVSAVRHILKRNEHITIMELCKESVGTGYAAHNDSNLSNYVKGNQK